MKFIYQLIFSSMIVSGALHAQTVQQYSTEIKQQNCPQGYDVVNCTGMGTLEYPNGEKYIGQLNFGKPEGSGTLILKDGFRFVGTFIKGVGTQGLIFGANGSSLDSDEWPGSMFIRIPKHAILKNVTTPITESSNSQQIENQRLKTHPTDALAVQPYKAQSSLPACPPSGYLSYCFGSYIYPSGKKYLGEFKADKRDGMGTFYDSNGSVINQGIWSFDSFIRSAPLQQANAPSVMPNSAERDRLTAEVDAERKKRQELEEQLRVAQQRPVASQTASNSSIGKRIALVVGNANYKVRPLKNSRNDADDISRSLKATGFEVIDLRDATLPQMRTALRQFGDRLISNDVGLVYYSGHGVEVKGRNYFIPVNADIQREDEIADQGLDVSLILEKMSTAGKGVNILIVDACRDDPFGRSFRSSSRGLANMDAPRGTIIAYATSPGKVASDGDPRERNSPYTKHLVKAMQSPNKPIEQVFKEVRRAVQDETKNQQTPWENTSLSGDFFFRVQR